jgi:poly-gamma-glutamate synthesis protein (capsule biosynthesis protein)
LKKISVLFIFAFTFLLGCSIRTEISVQEGLQKSADELHFVDRVTLSAIGDIMVHGAQLKSAWDTENNSYNFEPIFSPVKDFLSAADLTIANLETTLPGRKKLYAGYPRFGTPDALAAALQGAGVDILTTANNHACDTGKRGVIRTIKVLDAHGLLHVGTYRNKKAYETQRILIVERNRIRLAFLSYTYGLNGMPIPKGTYVNLTNQQQILNDIHLARAQNPDFIIVLLHCGTEYERYPDQFQQKMATFLFHEGADIVLGSHPHVLQPFELQSITDKYGDTKPRLVIYSLGNFVSNQRDRYRDGGIIFNFTVQKHHPTDKGETLNITNVHYIPTWVYIHRTTDKNQFYVLPVLKYLKNDQQLQLPDDAYQKMLTFYKDTQLHLQPSQKQVKKTMNRQQLKRKH